MRPCGRAGFHFLSFWFLFLAVHLTQEKSMLLLQARCLGKGKKQCDHGDQKFSEPKWVLVVYYRSDKGGRDHISMWW